MSQRVRNMYYIEGSAVRKIEAAPERRTEYRPERRVEQRPGRRSEQAPARRQENKRVRSERRYTGPQAQKALAFNFKYTVCVIMSVLIMVVACFTMLFMESKINEQQNNINELESRLETLQDDNAAFRVSLENMYSLDQIYDVATNELGMVYAKKGQIVYYDSANEDYVKQYQDVPEAN